MSMTREEAIEALQKFVNGYEKNICGEAVRQNGFVQAIKVVISALRPVTREQVEKAWRGEWQVCFEEWQNHRVEGEQCSKCGFQNYGPSNLYNFCPKCGSPITDKAVDMVMERLEALGYGKDD